MAANTYDAIVIGSGMSGGWAAKEPQRQPQPTLQTLPSTAFPFGELNGRQSGAIQLCQILSGTTHTGYKLDLHESELPSGDVPHPPHRHVNEELLFVREGEMEVSINGQWTKLPAVIAIPAQRQQNISSLLWAAIKCEGSYYARP